MNITKDSAIVEKIEAIVSERELFGFIDEVRPILLVEGSDDVKVIERHYYFSLDKQTPFRIVTGEDFNKKVSGKQSALESYHEFKGDFQKIICLLDRDFDYFLGENETDENIVYYDYYELENYLFDEAVLKLFFARYFNCTEKEMFHKLVSEFGITEEIYYPFSKLGFFRELNYRMRLPVLLSEFQISKISNMAKTSPVSILQNSSSQFKSLSLYDKMKRHVETELKVINISFEEIDTMTSLNESAATRELDSISDNLYFFKYLIGAKFILGSLHIVLKDYVDSMPFQTGGNTASLESSLKNEWIPMNSLEFKELINKIENLI